MFLPLLASTDAPRVPALAAIWPFAAMLVALAVLPLLHGARHWWEKNTNKLLLALGLAAVTLLHYQFRGFGFHEHPAGAGSVAAVLQHSLLDEYVPFMTLLFSLYVVAGGIVLRGDLRATPLTNSAFLAVGGLLASVFGTTGASMILIRPLLNTNRERTRVTHTVVFFIFIVSNAGGLLLPIGDPPLFLGYLRGVPFFWTLQLWRQWALTLAALLIIYYLWDCRAYRREPPGVLRSDRAALRPLRLAGGWNFAWLLLIVAAVATLDPSKPVPGADWRPWPLLREGLLLGLTGCALLSTPAALRRENQFNYASIGEVAAVFLGIFITMQVPLEILHTKGGQLGLVKPLEYFWITGLLSSVLDNAPTYAVFFGVAGAAPVADGQPLVRLLDGSLMGRDVLAAISCGAVLFGAMTYIGNGPNFMVKAVAEGAGVKMPTFFGFLAYSGPVLLPLFFAVWTFVG